MTRPLAQSELALNGPHTSRIIVDGRSSEGLLDVLLVDDDRDDLALFGAAVKGAQVNIWLRTAVGAEEAIAYLDGKGDYANRATFPLPDMLLLDLIMPGMDGFEFLAWRRGRPEFSRLPVMVLSGLGVHVQIERALALGADGYFAKPATLQGWLELVHRVWNLGVKHAR